MLRIRNLGIIQPGQLESNLTGHQPRVQWRQVLDWPRGVPILRPGIRHVTRWQVSDRAKKVAAVVQLVGSPARRAPYPGPAFRLLLASGVLSLARLRGVLWDWGRCHME